MSGVPPHRPARKRLKNGARLHLASYSLMFWIAFQSALWCKPCSAHLIHQVIHHKGRPPKRPTRCYCILSWALRGAGSGGALVRRRQVCDSGAHGRVWSAVSVFVPPFHTVPLQRVRPSYWIKTRSLINKSVVCKYRCRLRIASRAARCSERVDSPVWVRRAAATSATFFE